ncbi:MAG: BTAD domain-containing putative transcriptional regulator [Gaiellaceae bacterium]
MLDLRVLGPLEAHGDNGPIALGGQKQRALLSLLVLNAGRVVATDRLLDELWGEHPPRTAGTSLQNMVSNLRKALGPERVETRPPGYRLVVDEAETDVGRFERLVSQARDLSGEPRSRMLSAALSLWRGPPLADFAYETFAQAEIRRLDERRLSALEERIDADLGCGRERELVAELEALVDQQPFRERLRGQYMLALYRAGRQAEALQSYHDARRALVDELGIEPGRPLQDVFARILRHDPTLDVASAMAAPSAADTRPIAEAMAAGRLVFVLGSGVNLGSTENGDELPVRENLAPRLAAACGCPAEIGSELTKVAQYVAITQGIGPLYDALHLLLDREYEPTAVHQFLAELPALLRQRGAPQPLLVTTNYDRALEHALAATGEEPDVVSYVSLGRDRGKFLHRSADGSVRLIQAPNAYADVPVDRRPVIMKIHGEVDPGPERDAESFVVSEDDHIAYLVETGISGVLPVTLAARLRRSHFLFLGYGLVDWSFRVFLQRLWPDEQPAYRSWAVQPGATSLEREFWRRRGVELVDLPLTEAVSRVREHLAAALEPTGA